VGKGVVALGIIGMILATGAIGFAFVVWNGQNTTNTELNDLTDAFNDLESDFNNLTAILNNLNQTIVVGLWDGLEHNLDFAPYNSQSDWLYEFEYNKLNNTDYISVSNTNTRITLLKPYYIIKTWLVSNSSECYIVEYRDFYWLLVKTFERWFYRILF